MKKWLLFLCSILFLASIYYDLTSGIIQQTNVNNQDQPLEKQIKITVVKTKVHTRDTVLSIVEDLNDQNQSINQLNVSQIMDDFKTLNPDISPLEIEEGKYYYFPVYENNTNQVAAD